MTRHVRLWLCLVTAVLLATSQGATADRHGATSASVNLRVVDVADDRAYLEPGAGAGLAVGDEVSLNGERYQITAVSSSFAMVSLQGKAVALGARGTARIAKPGERVELKPEAPPPLASFRSEWRASEPPSSRQVPKPVPLGGSVSTWSGASRASVSDAVFSVIPRSNEPAFIGNELRTRLHYQPYSATPLVLDADAALQTFWGQDFAQRPGAAARQLLRLRELSLTYGTAETFRGSLGRLRAAASFAGQLDGVRLEAPLTPELRLGAFGGAVPQTFNGMLNTNVTRFGADLTYQDAVANLRPRLVAGASASRFDGALDEKKAFAAFDLLPDGGRLGGHAQVSLFEPDNQWGAAPVELTSASLEADLELGVFHLGGRAQLQRPERSRWLATLLPREWLCWASPARARAPCSANVAMYSWLISGGIRAGKLTVDWGGQSAFTQGTDASNFGGFANLRWLDVIGHLHFDSNISVVSGSVLRSAAVMLAPGILFGAGGGDLSLRYRPAIVRYRATLEAEVEPALGGGLWLAPSDSFDIDLEGDWVRARELEAVIVQGVASWSLGF